MAGNSDKHKQKSNEIQRRPANLKLLVTYELALTCIVFMLVNSLVGIDMCQWHVA